jgi:hypothetical protein
MVSSSSLGSGYSFCAPFCLLGAQDNLRQKVCRPKAALLIAACLMPARINLRLPRIVPGGGGSDHDIATMADVAQHANAKSGVLVLETGIGLKA